METFPAAVRIERFRELAPESDAAVAHLIELFLEQMREQLDLLRAAIAQDAPKDVELIAHRCAGTSAVCGADAVSAPLLALEALARTGALTSAAQHIDAAAAAFVRTEDFLLGYVAGLSDGTR